MKELRSQITLPKPFQNRLFCDLKEICALTNFSRMTILRQIAKGMPVVQLKKHSRLQFPIAQALEWIVNNYASGDWQTPRKRGRPRKKEDADE